MFYSSDYISNYYTLSYFPYLDETITILKIDRDFGFGASKEKFT